MLLSQITFLIGFNQLFSKQLQKQHIHVMKRKLKRSIKSIIHKSIKSIITLIYKSMFCNCVTFLSTNNLVYDYQISYIIIQISYHGICFSNIYFQTLINASQMSWLSLYIFYRVLTCFTVCSIEAALAHTDIVQAGAPSQETQASILAWEAAAHINGWWDIKRGKSHWFNPIE